MCLFTNWSQMTSQNVVRTKKLIALFVTDVLTRFWHFDRFWFSLNFDLLPKSLNCLHPQKNDWSYLNFDLLTWPFGGPWFVTCHSWCERGRGKIKKQTAPWDERVRRAFHPLEMIYMYGHWWLSGGWDFSTEFFPGRFRDIRLKYKMSGLTVSHIWKTFCPPFDVPQRLIRTNEKICQMFSFTFICNITVLEIVLITKGKY